MAKGNRLREWPYRPITPMNEQDCQTSSHALQQPAQRGLVDARSLHRTLCSRRISTACTSAPGTALRNRATSRRRDSSPYRPDATPASASSLSRRATSARNASASFAARRASFDRSTAASRLRRDDSNCHFQKPASQRADTSARFSASDRACAASARPRARSYSRRQNGRPGGAAPSVTGRATGSRLPSGSSGVTVRRSRYGHAASPARRAVGVRRNPCRLTNSACGPVRSSPHGALPGSARFGSSALFLRCAGSRVDRPVVGPPYRRGRTVTLRCNRSAEPVWTRGWLNQTRRRRPEKSVQTDQLGLRGECVRRRTARFLALPASARPRSFSAPRVHASTAQLSVRHTGVAERLPSGGLRWSSDVPFTKWGTSWESVPQR